MEGEIRSGSRWTVGILAVWIALSAFLGFGSQDHLWNDLLVGLAVLMAGIPLVVEAKWEGWTAGVLGVWLVVAAFVPGLREGTGLVWDNLVVGVVLAAVALIRPRESSTKSPRRRVRAMPEEQSRRVRDAGPSTGWSGTRLAAADTDAPRCP